MPEARSFHEDFGRKHEVKGGSDRNFGLTVGIILVLIAGARSILAHLGWVEIALFVVGIFLFASALIAPRLLAPFNKAWTKLGLFLFIVVNPVIMGLIFITAVTPTGLLMRLRGKDLLHLKFDPGAKSYWIDREPPGPAPDTMKHQF